MPTNLYGPNDNFDLQTSKVLPTLIRRLPEANESDASEVVLWRTGTRRDFLLVDDLAAASLCLLENYDSAQTINVGVGKDATLPRWPR